MSKLWYYQVMGETIGPLTSAELRRAADGRGITRETLVMEGSHGKWVSAWCIGGLFDDEQPGPVETFSPTNNVSPDDLERIAAEALSGADNSSGDCARTPPAKSGDSARTPPADNLRYCPDCRQLVSKHADACVHCGRPFTSSRPSGSQGPHIVAIVCSVFLVVGCFLPWIQLGALFINRGISGPDGAIVLILAIIAIAAGLCNLFSKGIKLHWPYFLAGILALVIAVIDLVDVQDRATEIAKGLGEASELLLGRYVEVSKWQLVGSGLYIVLVSAVALIFAGMLAKFTVPQRGPQQNANSP